MSPRTLSGQSSIRLLSIAISAILLTLLYRSIDMRAVGSALRAAHLGWLVLAIGLTIPLAVFRAMRFAWVAPAGAVSGLADAIRLTLLADTFNLFVPAKAGDFAKSFYVARNGAPNRVAVAVVVYERLADLFGLTFWCLVFWTIERPQLRIVPSSVWLVLAVPFAASGVLTLSRRAGGLLPALAGRVAAISPRRLGKLVAVAAGWPLLLQQLEAGRRLKIVAFSTFVWGVQLTQIWLFAVSVFAGVPFLVCMSVAAIAIMAGQIPFTFSGLGARDMVLVALFAEYTTPEASAAIGILMTSRGLVPALAGLAIARPYLTTAIEAGRAWRSGDPQETR